LIGGFFFFKNNQTAGMAKGTSMKQSNSKQKPLTTKPSVEAPPLKPDGHEETTEVPTMVWKASDNESIGFISSDSTSVMQITEIEYFKNDDDDGIQEQVDSWTKKAVKPTPEDFKEIIDEGIGIVKQIAAGANLAINILNNLDSRRLITMKVD